MGGDLNLKKSWHPTILSNQKKVWEEERKALEERKRTDQMMKERQQERQIQELQQMQEAAGGKKQMARVDWMYSGPASGQIGTTEEMEGYLLGKRRVDGLLKGTDNQKLEKDSKEDSFMAIQNANTVRDTAMKIREDPLLAIKRQEQAAYEAVMNDPVKRRLMLKAAGKEGSDSSPRDHKRRKHHHHHHRSRRDSPDGRSHHRSSRRDDYEDEDSHRHRSHRKRRSPSSSRSRSPKPSYGSRRRSPSPYRRNRSYSLERRERSRSPYRSHGHNKNDKEIRKMQSWHHSSREPRPHQSRSPPQRKRGSPPAQENDMQAKLAAMQQAASDLDQDREKRLAQIAARDKQDAENEALSRSKNAKYGGRADFVNRLNKKVVDGMDLGERMSREKGGREREQEAY